MTNYTGLEERWENMTKEELIEEMKACNILFKKVAVNLKYVIKKIDEGSIELAKGYAEGMESALMDTLEGLV